MDFDALIGSRIVPWTDCNTTQLRQVRATPKLSAKFSRQRSHIKPPSHTDTQAALVRQIVFQPMRFVQIDTRWRKCDLVSAMCFLIRPLAIDALVTRGRRNLLMPTYEVSQSDFKLMRGKL